MAKVEIYTPFMLSWEGGFVDHPHDKGGATNKGITISTYERYCRSKGYARPKVERLKNITDNEVFVILKSMYWDVVKGDDITSQSIANLIVDWHWTSGTWAIKYVQQVLGVDADGVVGPKTITAINKSETLTLFNSLWLRREVHFMSLAAKDSTQQSFLRGWLNRLGGIKFGSLICNGGKKIEWDE